MHKPFHFLVIKPENTAFYLLILPVLSFVKPSFGQGLPQKEITRNIIWYTPAKRNTTINGVALGLMATPNGLKINGLNVEAEPLGAFIGIYAFMGTILSPLGSGKKDPGGDAGDLGSPCIFPDSTKGEAANIKGVSVSLGGLVRDVNMSGVALNGIIDFGNRMQGLEITGLMNLHYEFKGVMIAGLRNKVTTGTGLQVGLVNTCKKGRVVQIGLINRIGRRTIPFINFSLRRAEQQNPPATR